MTNVMKGFWTIYLVLTAITHLVFCGVSSKMDFGDEEDALTPIITNSTKSDDDDVEVKHTIVVSTKLKNNNRRGLHGFNDDDSDGTLTYNIGRTERPRKVDSGEVPVMNGYMAVETTEIRTPDSRYKTKIYPDAVFINRNVRDEFDTYPNIATNPTQWKPSSFFNNINWWGSESSGQNNIVRRVDSPVYQNPEKVHRRITDDGMRDFYCKRCRELSQGRGLTGCIQQRSNPWNYQQTTTPKIKIDGKLAKLN